MAPGSVGGARAEGPGGDLLLSADAETGRSCPQTALWGCDWLERPSKPGTAGTVSELRARERRRGKPDPGPGAQGWPRGRRGRSCRRRSRHLFPGWIRLGSPATVRDGSCGPVPPGESAGPGVQGLYWDLIM